MNEDHCAPAWSMDTHDFFDSVRCQACDDTLRHVNDKHTYDGHEHRPRARRRSAVTVAAVEPEAPRPLVLADPNDPRSLLSRGRPARGVPSWI